MPHQGHTTITIHDACCEPIPIVGPCLAHGYTSAARAISYHKIRMALGASLGMAALMSWEMGMLDPKILLMVLPMTAAMLAGECIVETAWNSGRLLYQKARACLHPPIEEDNFVALMPYGRV